MLTALSAVNSAGDKLDLPLGDSSSGYLVKGVSGLDPVKATFTTSTRANIPGSSFRSGTRESRNVVLSLELKPDFWNKTGESLRSRLYSFFNPGEQITIQVFLDGLLFGSLVGRTETFEADMFTKRPSATISILCFDPDIVGAPLTFGPFPTDSSAWRELTYAGTSPTGFVMELGPFVSARTGFQVIVKNSLGETTLNFSDSILASDTIKLSTVLGDKFIRRIRSGVQASVLYGASVDSRWALLQPGVNQVRVSTAGTSPFEWNLVYDPRYGGI